MRRHYQLYNDVVAAAFICGTSRVATIMSTEHWSTDPSTGGEAWHQEVAHRSAEPDGVRQQAMLDSHREFFEAVFLDLANKLDVEEADGRTFLDNSLLFWTQESGATTHDPVSMPVVTAGSAGGYFRTGQYVDYRDRENTSMAHDYMPEYELLRPGISYNQWLANVLYSMGVPREEFEREGFAGYGHDYREGNWEHDGDVFWPGHVLDTAYDPLPILTA
jgi:hypothetical protein